MRRAVGLGILLGLTLVLTACDRKSASPPPLARPPLAEPPEPRREPLPSATIASPNSPTNSLQHYLPEPPTSQTEGSASSVSSQAIDSGSWTSLRVAILAEVAPRLVRLDVQVDRQDLDTGFNAAVRQVLERLNFDLTQGVTWETLLADPLVASGWLGNLVATDQQRSQLIAMYDSQRDQRVQLEEFQAFLTRGLSRQPRLRLVAAQSEPALMQLKSPWGPIDLDQDGTLSQSEIEQAADALMRFDFDGDRILTLGELRGTREAATPMSLDNRSVSLLEVRPVLLWDPSQPDALSRALLERYSFTENVPRRELTGWSDHRFSWLDLDRDGELSRKELARLSDQALDLVIRAQFPDSFHNSDAIQPARLQAHLLAAAENGSEGTGLPQLLAAPLPPVSTAARVALDGCVLTIRQSDDYSLANRQQAAEYFQRALSDKLLEGIVTSSLELQPGAWEIFNQPPQGLAAEELPGPGNSAMAADAKTERAWRWLVGPRQWQLQVSWSISNSPWFELLDQNGDGRLSQAEVEGFAGWSGSLDRDGDGQLGPEEMPMSLLLGVDRINSRGFSSQLGGTTQEKRGAVDIGAPTWFTAMDYNSDGELSRSEFLGDESDFEQLDSNRDGVIQARELKVP